MGRYLKSGQPLAIPSSGKVNITAIVDCEVKARVIAVAVTLEKTQADVIADAVAALYSSLPEGDRTCVDHILSVLPRTGPRRERPSVRRERNGYAEW